MRIVTYQSILINSIYREYESKIKKHKEQCNDDHGPGAQDIDGITCVEYRGLMRERKDLYDISNRYFFYRISIHVRNKHDVKEYLGTMRDLFNHAVMVNREHFR